MKKSRIILTILVAFILGTVLLLVSSSFYERVPIINLLKKQPTPVQSCINEYEAKNLKPGEDFVPGEVIVKFQENLKDDEAKAIISSYGLVWKRSLYVPNSALIEVPNGTEFEWICKLPENSKIINAEQNGIDHTTQ